MKPTIVKSPLNNLLQVDIAALFGVTDRTIRNWDSEGLPGNGEGRARRYDWALVLPWYVARVSGSGGSAESPTDRQRKDKADADLAEMERDAQAEGLLDAGDVRRTWIGFLGRLKDNLLGLADRCAPEIEETMTLAERIAVIRRHVNGSLREVVAELQDQEPSDD